jgi:mannose-6-phosphate isomerase-like protein (cupin superfamily)
MVVVKSSEIKPEFRNGLSRQHILEGVCSEMDVYKCILKAGEKWMPDVYPFGDRTQFFTFVTPTGYVATREQAYNITDRAVFVPDYDADRFVIHAGKDDLEFWHFIGKQSDYDINRMNYIHIELPRFRLFKDAWRYVEGHTGGAGSKTKSHMVLEHRFLGRYSMGWNYGEGPTFIGEHTHPDLEQWYFMLPGCSMTYTAAGEQVEVEGGDATFTEKGTPHGSVVKENQKFDYFWVELATNGYMS